MEKMAMGAPNIQQQLYLKKALNENMDGMFDHDRELTEAPTRKHFKMVADLIKSNPAPAKRVELAKHHAEIFAKQNPRFDREKFMKACDAHKTISEGLKEKLSRVVDEATRLNLPRSVRNLMPTASQSWKNHYPAVKREHEAAKKKAEENAKKAAEEKKD